MGVRKTFEELKLTGQLPSPPGVGMRVLELTGSDDYAAQEIAETIMADSALTGSLLKLANSALHVGAEPMTTIIEATMRLGVSSVRNVALGLSLIDSHRSGACEAFDYEYYWAKSVARALSAQALSRHHCRGMPSEAYVMGLLCDIGTLTLATVYPERYSDLLRQTPLHARAALARREQEEFAISHSEVSAFMVESWGLPRESSEAILAAGTSCDEGHPTSIPLPPIAQLLLDADLIADLLMARPEAEAARIQALMRAFDQVRTRLGSEEAYVRTFHEKLSREFQDWLRLLRLSSRQVPNLQQLAVSGGRAQAASAPAEQPRTDEHIHAEDHSHADEHRHADRKPGGSPRDGIRILLVENDPSTLRVLKQALEREGHTLVTAVDGREALHAALQHNPQAVITNAVIPKMDGIELCRTLRTIEQGREMYFLLMTDNDDEAHTVRAFEAGVDDFMRKPIKPRLLTARIKSSQRLLEMKAARERERREMREHFKLLAIAERRHNAAANTDSLTGLPNRRAILEILEAEWDRSIDAGQPLSVIMMDIDHFKQTNDQHGHDVGDEVLRELSRILRNQIRQGEDVARLGGEEFLVLCTNARQEEAMACAERLRSAIEHQLIRAGSFHGSVTASFGVAERTPRTADINALLKQADEAVYLAKSNGRNCIRSSSDGETTAMRA